MCLWLEHVYEGEVHIPQSHYSVTENIKTRGRTVKIMANVIDCTRALHSYIWIKNHIDHFFL